MTKVLISGASVAGPALAYFLSDHCDVTVVERAPGPRDSGWAIDFRGGAIEVLAELGISDRIRDLDTRSRGTAVLDADGAKTGELPREVFSGELEVPKRDLTRLLHEITADRARYVFDDSITSIRDGHVEFERSPAADYDLVIGADGVYSKVRRLAFGPAGLLHLGLSGVGFSMPNHLGLDHSGLLWQHGGAFVYLFSGNDPDRLTVGLSFGTESPELDRRSRAEQERATRAAFAGHGWEIPRLLDAMAAADDFWFGSTCQVRIDSWSAGRVALVGDAGYCAAPTSGMGTSQALIGARTLARCLLETSDHEAALVAYERELRPYVAENQEIGRAHAQSLTATPA
ncbi:FAD-dependent monooxygenase [Kutzneria kofuensis]|uniref:2-polyprenyl-6-methoxyphenol hydroxylase-like FAD-dependent oxidoreductase n=1 Tax=Kutzneria kofuensis TaxID=103725 RepID=A0A7W9KRL0_9PSEU|nr:FAD-dependent monooxygenase [Kutzneria kofuensis]MBB5897448.1 2-polyprenyl-6-methoxyphenol hydroxylase-like FAD-dependent oxidoreductase [Kutzneria kofuensis]